MRSLLVLALALAACGDNTSNGKQDAGIDGPKSTPDASPDAPPAATFTSFVIDLVKNHTADTTAAVPYTSFQALPDPDTNNGSAYNPLFP